MLLLFLSKWEDQRARRVGLARMFGFLHVFTAGCIQQSESKTPKRVQSLNQGQPRSQSDHYHMATAWTWFGYTAVN